MAVSDQEGSCTGSFVLLQTAKSCEKGLRTRNLSQPAKPLRNDFAAHFACEKFRISHRTVTLSSMKTTCVSRAAMSAAVTRNTSLVNRAAP